MADYIRYVCDTLCSAVGHLGTLRVSEIRQSFDLLGVQHTEVLLGLVVFVLMQFTKFAAILMLAVCLAYGTFYMWDNYFPGIAEFGFRGIKMCRNVRTYANLPPFVYSDGDESSGTGEYVVTPTAGYPRRMSKMLVPMLKDSNKIFQNANVQTGSPLVAMDAKGRGSRGQDSLQDGGKRRQEHRHYWRPVSSEREGEREHRSSRRNGHDVKRASNVLRIPKVLSGAIETRRLSTVTSQDLKHLPNVTSGESRRTHKEVFRRLPTITSAELGSRKVPRITSRTNESPRWLNMATGVTESRRGEERRRSKSSRHHDGGESRHQSHAHGTSRDPGESKHRRSLQRPYPAQGRRQEEHPPRQSHWMPASSDDNRPTKNRRSANNTTRSGVIRRQYPDDYYERLRMENRDFQSRRHGASGGHPTSEGAMLTQQENYVTSFRRSDRREAHRCTKSSSPGKEGAKKSRRDRKKGGFLSSEGSKDEISRPVKEDPSEPKNS